MKTSPSESTIRRCIGGFINCGNQALPALDVCYSCLEDGWGKECPNCGVPGGGPGYCSEACEEADAA
ncbi:hypothetical protein ACGFIF_42845 [Kribbella sp. NPDC049174]|uniref:hypothetical protein n=1 Tax=Kribbella sp. NPDC049174 TaxID=3364112 RepID=UPI0037126CF8